MMVEAMTLEEKVAQMMILPYSHMSKREAIEWVKRGVGLFYTCRETKRGR